MTRKTPSAHPLSIVVQDQEHIRGGSRSSREGVVQYTAGTVSVHPADNSEQEHLELPVEELLRRARPLPDHDEMAIGDLTEEEGEAFLAAVAS